MYNKVTKDRKLPLSPKTTENTAYTQQMENVQYYLLLLYTYQVTFGKLEHTASACLLLENYLKQQSKNDAIKKNQSKMSQKNWKYTIKGVWSDNHYTQQTLHMAIHILKIRYCNWLFIHIVIKLSNDLSYIHKCTRTLIILQLKSKFEEQECWEVVSH